MVGWFDVVGSVCRYMSKVILLSPVSTGMDDHLWAGMPPQYVTNAN